MNRALGVVIALLILLAVIVRRDRLEPLAGRWAIGRPLISSGDMTLYRVGAHPSFQRTRVERQLSYHKFYPPDCVLYTTHRSQYPYVYAVCGDRSPVIVGKSSFSFGR